MSGAKTTTAPLLLPAVVTIFIAGHVFASVSSTAGSPVPTAREVEEQFSNTLPMTPDDVRQVVANAVDSERAVIFIHVDWSLTSVMHMKKFADYFVRHSQEQTDNDLLFHFADCSSISLHQYRPLREIPGWSQYVATNSWPIHGEGEIIWLDGGRVVHVQDVRSYKEFCEITGRVLPARER